jgi:homoserine kinase
MSNLTIQAMRAAFRLARRKLPSLCVRMDCRIPIGRGLGSSAAAIVGGVVAANALMKNCFSQDELLALAAKIEGHPDNVAPALLGGLVVSVQGKEGLVTARLNVPSELKCVVFVPDRALSTKAARAVLPQRIPRASAIFNAGRTALWVAAVKSRQWDWLDAATQDSLHQPFRARLVPGMNRLFDAAREAGARGAALSGAGPSIVAFVIQDADKVERAMARAAKRMRISGKTRVIKISNRGAHLT